MAKRKRTAQCLFTVNWISTFYIYEFITIKINYNHMLQHTNFIEIMFNKKMYHIIFLVKEQAKPMV